jgi:hypothetical protein
VRASPHRPAAAVFVGAGTPKEETMRSHWPRLCVAVAIAAVGLLPLTAMASTFTLAVGSPTLTDRTLITVPVTLSCYIDPTVANFIWTENISATIQQPAGRSFATASATLNGWQNSKVFPCDGSTVTVNLAMLANPAGPPFHGGGAILTTSVYVQAGFESFPGCGCGPFTFSDSAGTGPAQVTLH